MSVFFEFGLQSIFAAAVLGFSVFYIIISQQLPNSKDVHTFGAHEHVRQLCMLGGVLYFDVLFFDIAARF